MNRVINLKVLENLRTKEELIEYFKAQGIEITNEEIENLKQQYSSKKLNVNELTLNQLDDVAGGLLMLIKEMENPAQFVGDCNGIMRNVAYTFSFNHLGKEYVCVLVNDDRKETRVTDVGTRKLEIENGNSLVFQNEYSESLQQQGDQPVSHEYKILSEGDNTSIFNDIISHSSVRKELTEAEKRDQSVIDVMAGLMTEPGKIRLIDNPTDSSKGKIRVAYEDGHIYSLEERLLIHDGTKLTIGEETKPYYKSVFEAYEQSLGANSEHHYSRNFGGLQVFESSLGVERQHHEIPHDGQGRSRIVGEQTPLVTHATKATEKPHKSNELSGCKVAFCVALGLVVAAGLTTGAYYGISYLVDKNK